MKHIGTFKVYHDGELVAEGDNVICDEGENHFITVRPTRKNMSQTHSIVCHATKEKVWIGQGTGAMTVFYSGEPDTMEALKWFLQHNREHDLNIICNDADWACLDYVEWSGTYNDGWRISYNGVERGVFKGTLPEAVREAMPERDHLNFLPVGITYEEVNNE